jgi:uncharacterized protein
MMARLLLSTKARKFRRSSKKANALRHKERAMALVEVTVEGVGLDTNHGPVVILREVNGTRMLPIWIGHGEAAAIQMKLDGQDYLRPLTHDLVQNIVQILDARLVRVDITELKDSTYYAALTLITSAGETVTIDARPSDSIALVLRAEAELFADDSLFRSEMPEPGEMPSTDEPNTDGDKAEHKRQELRRRLRGIDPGDFGSFKLGG